jgi:AcrR family transcriptional regulator
VHETQNDIQRTEVTAMDETPLLEGEGEDEEVFLPLHAIFAGSPRDRRERAPRRVRGLSRADIVTAAIAVADAEGPDAVSMRRLARELRVGTMSLYWHVVSKEELHQLMLERLQAEIEVPEPSGDWRMDLRAYAIANRASLLRHPWALDFLASGPPSGPNDARNLERLLAAVDGLGVDPATTMWLIMTVATYVVGAVLREVQEIRWQRSVAEATADMTGEELAEAMAEFGRRVRAAGRYPHMVRFMDEGIDPDAPETRDERFEFGLDCMLDGIAARVKSARRCP